MVSQDIVDYSVSSQDMSSVEMFQMTKQDPTKLSSETMMPGGEETASGDVNQMSPVDTTTEDVQTASGDVNKMSPVDTMPGDERDTEASKKPSPKPKDETPTKIQSKDDTPTKIKPKDETPTKIKSKDIEPSKKPSPQLKDETPTKIQPKDDTPTKIPNLSPKNTKKCKSKSDEGMLKKIHGDGHGHGRHRWAWWE